MSKRSLRRLTACGATGLAVLIFSLARGDEPSKAEPSPKDDSQAAARNKMVKRHLEERGIKDPRVLEAFRTVPRHRFLPPKTQRLAYDDESIPIGEGQTITPPTVSSPVGTSTYKWYSDAGLTTQLTTANGVTTDVCVRSFASIYGGV